MLTAAASQGPMRRALLASFGVHVLAALLIPALAFTMTSGTPVETITFTRVAHIEIQRREPPRPQPRAAAPVRSAERVISEATRVELSHTAHRISSPPPATAYRQSTAPVVASAPRAGNGTTDGEAAPQTTASPAAASRFEHRRPRHRRVLAVRRAAARSGARPERAPGTRDARRSRDARRHGW